MKIKKFEDIIAWQKAQDLAVLIYAKFSELRDFGFKDQICRATVSISNNIAEGFDRSSDADFVRFLYIAFSSCSDVKSMIYLSSKLKYTNNEDTEQLINKATEVSKINMGLIKAIKN